MEGTGAASPANDYTYNGKEWNDDLGLNWYDYGARWYDADVGRWWAVDPLALISAHQSVYNYALNNAIRYIDPDGLAASSYRYNWNARRYEDKGGNEVSWSSVYGSIQSETPEINVLSVSRKTDKLVNRSIPYLQRYLVAANINARVTFHRSSENFDITTMSTSDAAAVVSDSKDKTVDYILKNFDTGYLSTKFKQKLEVYRKAPASKLPEVSDNGCIGGWGRANALKVSKK